MLYLLFFLLCICYAASNIWPSVSWFFLPLQLAIKFVIEIDIAIEIKIENGAEQLFAGLVVAEQQAICCRGLK